MKSTCFSSLSCLSSNKEEETGTKAVAVRKVWEKNLEAEFAEINKIFPDYSFASIETKFPGLIFLPDFGDHRRCIHILYIFMRENIKSLNLIQLRLTLSNSHENSNSCYIWEFNFRDFDLHRHRNYPGHQEKKKILKRQGINFRKYRDKGISSWVFAKLYLDSALVFNRSSPNPVTFHSALDFGFLINIFNPNRKLPYDVREFMRLVHLNFGLSLWDVEHMMRLCVALYDGSDPVAGETRQARSDSAPVMECFVCPGKSHSNGQNLTLAKIVEMDRAAGNSASAS